MSPLLHPHNGPISQYVNSLSQHPQAGLLLRLSSGEVQSHLIHVLVTRQLQAQIHRKCLGFVLTFGA